MIPSPCMCTVTKLGKSITDRNTEAEKMPKNNFTDNAIILLNFLNHFDFESVLSYLPD